MPSCTIVIPVFNKASLTRQCLRFLTTGRGRVDAEIVVVDDGSRDLTPRLLESYGDRIRVVTHPDNRGFARACNDGAMTASGEYLVFLNNDTMPSPGWLDALLRYAEAHPRAAVVGAKLLYPDDTVQHAGVVISQYRGPYHAYAGFPADHPAVNRSRRFQAVTGACMLVRRSAFEEVGGFDEAYHNCYEDVDLCFRMAERGYETHYCHESVLYHLQSMSRGKDVHTVDPYKDVEYATRLLMMRWGKRVEQDDIRYYVEDGLLTIKPVHPNPVILSVSPLLAVVEAEERLHRSDQLILERTRRVYDLVQEQSRLEARLRDLELHLLADQGAESRKPPGTWVELRTQATLFEVRNAIAGLYLQGDGIEIGALHSPVHLPDGATVRYVDRMPVDGLRRHYPELDGYALTEPDILDDGERLPSIDDASQDFVIASHFLEHCQDPIGAMTTLCRVVRPGGLVYLAIPDKRFTFDRHRPVTPFDHLVRDHEQGPAWSRRAHFDEWVTLGEDESTRGKTAEELMAMEYSIHFHVWTQTEMIELFGQLRARYALPLSIELMIANQLEVIFVLRKDAE